MFPAVPSSLPPWAPVALRALRGCLLGANTVTPTLWADAQPHLPELRKRRLDSVICILTERSYIAQDLYEKVWGIQRAALEDVLVQLEHRGLQPATVKGAECIVSCFGGRPIYFHADVDVLLPVNQLEPARSALEGLGFQPARYDYQNCCLKRLTRAEVAACEAGHYELAPYKRLEAIELSPQEDAFMEQAFAHKLPLRKGLKGWHVMMTVDVHHGLASDLPVDPLWARARPSALGLGATLDPADQLWIGLIRYYHQITTRALRTQRDLAYAAGLIHTHEINWDIVVGAAREYELRPGLFYLLSFLDRLANGTAVPAEVLAALSPLDGTRLRDFGWFTAQLYDVLPAPPFDPVVVLEGEH